MAEFPAIAGSVPVVVLETVGSTNLEALARANSGEKTPVWIVARQQTEGHGRRGRTWVSEPGNLYASLLLVDPAPPAVVPGICFVAALALHDAILDTAQGLAPAQLQLKWPNDLLIDGKKLGGILVEGSTRADGLTTAVVGFGANCAHHPVLTEYPATDLTASGYPVLPEVLFTALGARMTARLQEWNRGVNFASIRKAWLARASGLGSAVEVRLANRTVTGVFEAIDLAGALVLRHRDGSHETIAAGDIFPLVPN